MALTTSIALPVSSAESDERSTAAATPPLFSRGIYSLFPQYHPRGTMTCDNVPRVCRASGSPGPDCCRKQCVNVMTDNQNCGQCGKKCWFGQTCCGGSCCVNVMTDNQNCGQCGKKCWFGQTCCGGRCVNVMYDPKNCGGCNKRCTKGCFCQFGMCSYA
ncbi:unnamed protein product [Musa acuminata subsp. malaccensis]|uniref:(wild Malaysian banana) hypothetical protein n=1 Tax=Musa acuminata subsp. malaccensis TaxID=214687 RepID=A0A8D6ZZJ8_MUSAM|nr:unnamed protein product [Musa acuminata subsp. malaccensis]